MGINCKRCIWSDCSGEISITDIEYITTFIYFNADCDYTNENNFLCYDSGVTNAQQCALVNALPMGILFHTWPSILIIIINY